MDRRDDSRDETGASAQRLRAAEGGPAFADACTPLPLAPFRYATAIARQGAARVECEATVLATAPRPLIPRSYMIAQPAAPPPAAFAWADLRPPRPLSPRRYGLVPPVAPARAPQAMEAPIARPSRIELILPPVLLPIRPVAVPPPETAPATPRETPPLAPTPLAAPRPLRLEVPRDERPSRQAAHVSALAPSPSSAPRESPFALAKRIGKIALLVFAGWMVAVLLLILLYRVVDPPMSSLMVQQRLSGQDIAQHWAPLEEISPDVIRAVMLSEDGRFCQHSGVDYEEIQNAIDRAGERNAARRQHDFDAGHQEPVPVAIEKLRAKGDRAAAHLCDGVCLA